MVEKVRRNFDHIHIDNMSFFLVSIFYISDLFLLKGLVNLLKSLNCIVKTSLLKKCEKMCSSYAKVQLLIQHQLGNMFLLIIFLVFIIFIFSSTYFT